MAKKSQRGAGGESDPLSRRERQIMEVLYRRERATAKEFRGERPAPPSYSAVRALLVILEEFF